MGDQTVVVLLGKQLVDEHPEVLQCVATDGFELASESYVSRCIFSDLLGCVFFERDIAQKVRR